MLIGTNFVFESACFTPWQMVVKHFENKTANLSKFWKVEDAINAHNTSAPIQSIADRPEVGREICTLLIANNARIEKSLGSPCLRRLLQDELPLPTPHGNGT